MTKFTTYLYIEVTIAGANTANLLKHCPHNARANTDVAKAQHNVTCFVKGLMKICAKAMKRGANNFA